MAPCRAYEALVLDQLAPIVAKMRVTIGESHPTSIVLFWADKTCAVVSRFTRSSNTLQPGNC
jgi:hypothetical protein